MLSPVKLIRAGFFGLVIVFFFLPFAVVSCPSAKKSHAVSGMELVTGTVVRANQIGATEDVPIKVHPLAIAALACAAAGVVFSFLKPKPSFVLCLAAGGAGIVFLILLRNQIGREAASFVAQGLRLYYASGWWTAVAGFSLAVIATLILNPFMKRDLASRLFRKRKR